MVSLIRNRLACCLGKVNNMSKCNCENCTAVNQGFGYAPCLKLGSSYPKMPPVQKLKPVKRDSLIKAVERSLKRSRENAKACEWMNENNSTFHGAWSKGYFDGKVAALEDILSEIKGE